MTICDKIQTVGETLEFNLNARGVSCTFGTGTGESTVLEMVEMVNGTNFKGSSDVNLKIGANRPYLLENETTDVVVKLEDGLCEPLKNKNVTIEQSLFRDNGTTASHNDIWILYNATLTRNASESTLLETTATGYAMSNQYNKIPPNSVVEFDICQTDGSLNYAPIYIRNDGGGVSLSNITYTNLGASIGDWVHIKIVFNNTDTITVYSDKLSEPFTKTLSATSTNYRVMLYCGGDMTTIKFKNFVVSNDYNLKTDSTGLATLYNMNVTDDTTFTATYGTETATCLVEYCVWVDYGVATEHIDHYYYVSNNGSIAVTDKGTKLQNSSGNFDLNMIPLDQTVSSSNVYKWNAPLVIEFDVVESTAINGEALVQVYSATTNSNCTQWIGSDIGHWKVEVNSDNTQNVYHNGTLKKSTSLTLTDSRIILRTTNLKYLTYKNFRIREG